MTRLQCELCGSIDIIKTDENVFQCQHCCCKYTLEQAKNLIFGGEVKTKATDFEITGGVLKKYNGEDVDVIVPENVVRIGERAFENLSIRGVKLPENLREIDGGAFQNCHRLTEIQLSDGVESIGEDAFVNCNALVSIDLPAKLKSGPLSFAGCSSLESIRFPEGVSSVCCSDCTSLQSAVLPESVTEIQTGAFAGCKSLQSIHLPEGLKRIYKGAFSGCVSLHGVYIPDNAKAVDADGIAIYSKAVLPWSIIFNDSNWTTFSFRADRIEKWRRANRCLHCGGEFVKQGLFNLVCSKCGRKKDYSSFGY